MGASRHPSRVFLGVAGLLAISSASALPQDERPTFRADVNVLLVDVIATDKNGRFVDGLGAEDFRLYAGGIEQEIVAFGLVDLGTPSSESDAVDLRDADYRVATNTFENGRVYSIVIDDLHISPERTGRTREMLRRFVEDFLQPGDVLSISLTSGQVGFFTEGAEIAMKQIESIAGRGQRAATLERLDGRSREESVSSLIDFYANASQAAPSERERGLRGRQALRMLRAQCEVLEAIPGRRKTLMWISEGLDYQPPDPQSDLYTASISEELSRILDASARANVAIYSVSPRGSGSVGGDDIEIASAGNSVGSFAGNRSILAPGSPLPVDDPSLGMNSLLSDAASATGSLRSVAALTGGLSVAHLSDDTEGFRRIVADSSMYYFLGFVPASDDEGQFRAIDVRVAREGVTVRARRGFVTAGNERSPTSEKASSFAPDVKALLREPLPRPDLELRAVATALGQDKDVALVAVTAWSPGTAFRFEEDSERFEDDVELLVAAVDPRGQLIDSQSGRVHIAIPREQIDSWREEGFYFRTVLRLEPGHYQLRVAVVETGKEVAGSVFISLDVPEPDAGMLRGLALSRNSDIRLNAPTLGRRPILPGPQSTSRVFRNDEQLITYLEYLNPKRLDANLVVELETSDGVPVSRFESQAPDSGGQSSVILTRRISLTSFTPDDYVLSFKVVDLDGRVLATRQTVFSVAP